MSVCAVPLCKNTSIWTITNPTEAPSSFNLCNYHLEEDKTYNATYDALVYGRLYNKFTDFKIEYADWTLNKVIATWQYKPTSYHCQAALCNKTDQIWKLHTREWVEFSLQHTRGGYEIDTKYWCNTHLPKETLGREPPVCRGTVGCPGFGLSLMEETWTPETY